MSIKCRPTAVELLVDELQQMIAGGRQLPDDRPPMDLQTPGDFVLIGALEIIHPQKAPLRRRQTSQRPP
jgi:hypothetical protein